jgi:phenylpropionate dioxygenase-like ring-hydroxylating dioxygenase large terminal subunit
MDGTTESGARLEPALSNEYYTSAEIYRREHPRIFYRSWLFLAHDSDLAKTGDYVAGHVADQAVFAIRGRDGTVRAFYNVCRHRGHRIVEGRGQAERVLICPYHAWSYEHTGALRSARGAERGADRELLGLRSIRIERIAGLWFVNLDPDAQPLAETAPGLEEQLLGESPQLPEYRRLCEGTFEVACNWKVFVENGLECYHCAPAHPGFCEIVDLNAYDIASYGTFTRHWGEMKAGGRYSSWKLFPLTNLRSSSDVPALVTFQLRPLAVDRFVQTLTLYGPAARASDHARLYRDWIDTSFVREDMALASSVQIGLSSRGLPGGLLMVSDGYESEHLLVDFQTWVRKALDG